MGQQAPGTPTTQDIQDAVEDLARGVLSRSPAPLGLGNIGFDECPFVVGYVCGIGFSGFHAPILLDGTSLLETF